MKDYLECVHLPKLVNMFKRLSCWLRQGGPGKVVAGGNKALGPSWEGRGSGFCFVREAGR